MVQKVGQEKEQLHLCEALSKTLTLANGEREHLGHRLEAAIFVQEAIGIEAFRVRKDLKC